MIQDALLELADAQASTVDVASTNVIDTLAAGDAYAGGMAGLFFVIRIDTAYTAGAGTPTATFQLQTGTDANMANGVTLVQSAAFIASELTAGKIIALPIPGGAKRYIRGYQDTNASGDVTKFSAGAFDMHIQKDAPMYRELTNGGG